jgi:hypothetical protein
MNVLSLHQKLVQQLCEKLLQIYMEISTQKTYMMLQLLG